MTDALKVLSGTIENVYSDTGTEERTVDGYITDGLVDVYGHMIDEVAMMQAIEEYKKWGNVRDMHGTPVGTAVEIGTKAWNYLKTKVVDDTAWKKAKEGVYKGFSVGILVLDGEFVPAHTIPAEKFAGLSKSIADAILKVGEVFKITALELVEVSLVDRPANPRATLLSVKNMDGSSYLPSVLSGGDALKTMYANKAYIGENKMEEAQVIETTVAEEEVEAEATDVTENKEVVSTDTAAEAVEPVVDEQPVEETTESTVEKSFEDRIAAIEASVSALVETISAVLDKYAAVEAEPAAEAEEALEADAGEEMVAEVVENTIEPQTVSLSLNEGDMERLAEMVSEKIIAVRKSTVVADEAGDEDSEPAQESPKLDTKSLTLSDLRRGIALRIAAKAKNGG